MILAPDVRDRRPLSLPMALINGMLVRAKSLGRWPQGVKVVEELEAEWRPR